MRHLFFSRPVVGRVILYLGGLSIAVGIVVMAVVADLRQHPQKYVERVLALLPYEHSVGRIRWVAAGAPSPRLRLAGAREASPPSETHLGSGAYTLELSNVKIGNFFYANTITISSSLRALAGHHIELLAITGGQIFTGPLLQALQQGARADAASLDWTLDRVEIRRGTLLLNHFAADLQAVPIRLGLREPVVLHDLRLNRPDATPEMTTERTIDIESVRIVSPIDPLAAVFSLPLVRLRFTYAELWRHHLREITLIRPVMYLGQDLFWLSDQLRAERKASPGSGQGAEAPWRLDRFDVRYGQLAINAFGQPAAQLPFVLETTVDDVRLDQLDKITLKSAIVIKRLDQEYPDYKVKIVNLDGRLDFSLPPGDATANNVVPTLHVQELSWNGIAATDVWSSVTFDPTGIYGKLGGHCEKGYLKANFEIYYTKGFTWNVDLFADKIEMRPIAEKLAGKYFDLTGALDGKLSVKGRSTEILSCQGALNLPRSGTLTIASLNDLVSRLPADTPVFKRDAIRIAVEAFRLYPYDLGQLEVQYTPNEARAGLRLEGPKGKRRFDVYWHPLAE